MKTRQTIAAEIIDEAKKEIPIISNYRTGGVFRLFVEVVASFMEKFYTKLEALLPNRFLQTAQGKYLDLKAEELSIFRRLPTKTRGYIVFSRRGSDITKIDTENEIIISKDKIVATKPNSQGKVFRYSVVKEDKILEGEISKRVLVEAEQEGSMYNVMPNMITELINPISGIDNINNPNTDWVSLLGQDIETDDSLRNRAMALWKGLNGANKGAYIAWAKTVEGIGDIRVLSKPRGVGTVDVICVGIDNKQPSEELLKRVQDVIDENRPIATDVLVKAPVEVNIDIKVKVMIYPSYPKNKQKISETIDSYFNKMSIGKDFEPSALVGILHSIEDVKSVSIEAEAKRISELQVARKGNVNIIIEQSIES